MYVQRLYIMELECLHVNTSYSITKEYLQHKCLHSLTYMTMCMMASQGLWQQLHFSGHSFPALDGGEI
jgi:hypothetical protein